MKLASCALIFAISVAVIGSHLSEAATDKIFCYYGSWATYRHGNGKFDVENIDPKLCTHVIYTFIGITYSGGVKLLDNWNDISLGSLNKFVSLRIQNPNLKVMVAMGGWNEGSASYSTVAASSYLRNTLVDNVIGFLRTYKFDGFDLDWEYPGMRGGSAEDKANFISLLSVFRQRFDAEGYILTAAVGVTNNHISYAYDIPNMAKYLHYINLMAYDLHGTWDGVTGQNSPLYASSIESSAFSALNVDAIVKNWLAKGAPAESLVLGIPFYGHTYLLSSSTNTKLGASIASAGMQGEYTMEAGSMTFLEICETLNLGGWTTVFDNEQKVPYSFSGRQWIGYDNPASVKLKSAYAVSKGLGGVMVWSIEQDDARGVCGLGKYPMLTALREGLSLTTTTTGTTATTTTSTTKSSGTTTTTTPATTTSTTTTTKSPSTGTFTCTAAGSWRDPNNCAKYYVCERTSSGSYKQTPFTCSGTLVYDTVLGVCNWPQSVTC